MMTTTVEITVAGTGEVISLPAKTPEEVTASYDTVNAYLEAYKRLKMMLHERGMYLLKEVK